MNCYPKHLVEKHIEMFISDKFASNEGIVSSTKEIKHVTLPFMGSFSYHVRNTVSNLLKQTIPDVNFRFIFVNRNTIVSLFKCKDSLPAHFVLKCCLFVPMS